MTHWFPARAIIKDILSLDPTSILSNNRDIFTSNFEIEKNLTLLLILEIIITLTVSPIYERKDRGKRSHVRKP